MTNDDTEYEDGDNAYDAGDYEAAYRIWKSNADAGDAEAQYSLGILYYYGEGVAEDAAEAVKWFRLAADQDHSAAQTYMGRAYDDGIGVETDDAEAVRWYRAAAAQGQRVAQHNLARMLELGEGIEDDIWEAIQWYEAAANLGYAEAQFCLGRIHEEGNGPEVDQAKAVEYYEMAAEQGHEEALERLAALETNESSGKVAESSRSVADALDAEAHFLLAEDFRRRDARTKAKKNYRAAAAMGHAQSMYELGQMAAENTRHAEPNIPRAIKWYRMAAATGHGEARAELKTLTSLKSRASRVLVEAARWVAFILFAPLLFVLWVLSGADHPVANGTRFLVTNILFFIFLLIVQEFALQADWYAENVGVIGPRFDVIRDGVGAVMGWL